MADYNLEAQYPKQQVVRDRNLGGLVAWAAYTGTQPIPPTKPPEEWVQQRLVAERIPLNSALYVERTVNFFLMDPATKASLRELMSPWNDETQEIALSTEIQNVIGTFMPHFAALDIPDAAVQQWYVEHGFDGVAPAQPMQSMR